MESETRGICGCSFSERTGQKGSSGLKNWTTLNSAIISHLNFVASHFSSTLHIVYPCCGLTGRFYGLVGDFLLQAKGLYFMRAFCLRHSGLFAKKTWACCLEIVGFLPNLWATCLKKRAFCLYCGLLALKAGFLP